MREARLRERRDEHAADGAEEGVALARVVPLGVDVPRPREERGRAERDGGQRVLW